MNYNPEYQQSTQTLQQSSNNEKVPVSPNVLIRRINRRISKNNQRLYTSRGPRAELDLGRHYINIRENSIVASLIDLEGLARDLGALQPWEELGD